MIPFNHKMSLIDG